jgi:hypothetical protein
LAALADAEWITLQKKTKKRANGDFDSYIKVTVIYRPFAPDQQERSARAPDQQDRSAPAPAQDAIKTRLVLPSQPALAVPKTPENIDELVSRLPSEQFWPDAPHLIRRVVRAFRFLALECRIFPSTVIQNTAHRTLRVEFANCPLKLELGISPPDRIKNWFHINPTFWDEKTPYAMYGSEIPKCAPFSKMRTIDVGTFFEFLGDIPGARELPVNAFHMIKYNPELKTLMLKSCHCPAFWRDSPYSLDNFHEMIGMGAAALSLYNGTLKGVSDKVLRAVGVGREEFDGIVSAFLKENRYDVEMMMRAHRIVLSKPRAPDSVVSPATDVTNPPSASNATESTREQDSERGYQSAQSTSMAGGAQPDRMDTLDVAPLPDEFPGPDDTSENAKRLAMTEQELDEYFSLEWDVSLWDSRGGLLDDAMDALRQKRILVETITDDVLGSRGWSREDFNIALLNCLKRENKHEAERKELFSQHPELARNRATEGEAGHESSELPVDIDDLNGSPNDSPASEPSPDDGSA